MLCGVTHDAPPTNPFERSFHYLLRQCAAELLVTDEWNAVGSLGDILGDAQQKDGERQQDSDA